MEIKEQHTDALETSPPTATSATQTLVVHPKPKVGATTELPFHIHHCIVGAAIAGASLLVLLIPDLKPTTKYVVAGLGVSIGAALVYDDLVQHVENSCDFSSIINFTPCTKKVVKVVTAPLLPLEFPPEA